MQIEYEQLKQAIAAVFSRHGVGEADATGLGRELAEATFAGYESHGIGRVKPYLAFMTSGTIDPGGRLTVVRETPATALLDAGHGFGVLRALEAADRVAAKAKTLGLAAAAVRNCGDAARLAPYAERLAQAGLIGMVMANDAGSGMVVAPHGGTQPLLSTNPLAVGIPRPVVRPIVFDLATSQIAVGAAKAATRRGVPIQPDTLVGRQGETVTDPQALFDGLAALLPLGGTAFGFKGTALGLCVEVLAGGLSGDGLSGDHPARRGRNSIFLWAVDPAAFDDPAAFHSRVDAFLERIRANAPRPGFSSVRVPGEHGPASRPGDKIEVLDDLWDELRSL